MLARIKKLFSDWREDRRRLRALLIQLETLTDPHFLQRASFYEGTCTVQEAIEMKFKGII